MLCEDFDLLASYFGIKIRKNSLNFRKFFEVPICSNIEAKAQYIFKITSPVELKRYQSIVSYITHILLMPGNNYRGSIRVGWDIE